MNGFVVEGLRGSLGAKLGDGVSHVIALDARVGLDFEDMCWEGVRLYLFEDIM